MAGRSKARVCSRSLAGIAGLYPAGGMDVCLLCVFYSKDKRHSQDNQDKVVVQMKYREKKIPPGAWMSVCCECCVLSGRGLCDGPISRPEESY